MGREREIVVAIEEVIAKSIPKMTKAMAETHHSYSVPLREAAEAFKKTDTDHVLPGHHSDVPTHVPSQSGTGPHASGDAVAAELGTGRLRTVLASGERGSLRLPGSGGRDLRGLSTKQAEKLLKQFDTDPHSFKEELVGSGSISKFDIKMGPGGELHLASKDGSVVIPTGVIPR